MQNCVFLSVQCNILHGTEYNITCGVYLSVCVCSYDRGLVGKCMRSLYHGLVGNASVVTNLWGTAQGITLNLSVLGYFKSFERYLIFPHKAMCVSFFVHGCLGSNISKTLRDRDLVPMEH